MSSFPLTFFCIFALVSLLDEPFIFAQSGHTCSLFAHAFILAHVSQSVSATPCRSAGRNGEETPTRSPQLLTSGARGSSIQRCARRSLTVRAITIDPTSTFFDSFLTQFRLNIRGGFGSYLISFQAFLGSILAGNVRLLAHLRKCIFYRMDEGGLGPLGGDSETRTVARGPLVSYSSFVPGIETPRKVTVVSYQV